MKISGKVIDKQTGAPLQLVNLAIKGTSKGTYTDQDGNFSLEVPASKFLHVSHLGHKSLEFKPQRSNLTIELEPTVHFVNEVTITPDPEEGNPSFRFLIVAGLILIAGGILLIGHKMM